MNLIVPVAGEGSRFKAAGFQDPQPFKRIAGKRMIEWALDPIPDDWHIHLACKEEHLFNFNAWLADRQFYKRVTLHPICGPTEGAACTALSVALHLPKNEPVAVMNGDQWFSPVFRFPHSPITKKAPHDAFITCEGLQALQEFAMMENWDGYILTFTGSGIKWSYVKESGGWITQVKEKEEISQDATVGFYWFRRTWNLVRSCTIMIAEDLRSAHEFYLAPCYNELIWRFRQRIKRVPTEDFWGLGTPEDVKLFEDKRQSWEIR